MKKESSHVQQETKHAKLARSEDILLTYAEGKINTALAFGARVLTQQ